MLTQTLKDVALTEFVARTSDPRNRRRLTSKLVEDAFIVAEQFVQAENAYDARQRDIAPADNARPKPSPVDVQLWDPEAMAPMVRDGKPVMTTVTPDVGAFPAGLDFNHHFVQAHLIGRLELGMPLPSCLWTMEQEIAIKSLAADAGVANPLEA